MTSTINQKMVNVESKFSKEHKNILTIISTKMELIYL